MSNLKARSMQEPLLTPSDLAFRWSVSVQTLTNWRNLKKGPVYVKLGKGCTARIRYRLGDIERFESDFSIEGRTDH